MLKKTHQLLLRILVGLALIGLLLSRVELKILKKTFFQMPPIYWSATVLAILLGVFISSTRLNRLMRSFAIRVPLMHTFRIYLICSFLGNFLPSTVGGDVAKFAYLQKYAEHKTHMAVAIFLDRLTGLMAMLLLGLIGLFVCHELVGQSALAWLLIPANAAALVLIIIIRFYPPKLARCDSARHPLGARVHDLFFKLHVAIHTIGRDNKTLFASMALSFLFFAQCILVSQIVAVGLGYRIGILDMTMVVVLVQLITMLPVSINGIGLREWAYVVLLGRCGVPAEAAAALSLIVYFSVLAVSLIGGILYLTMRRESPKVTPTGANR